MQSDVSTTGFHNNKKTNNTGVYIYAFEQKFGVQLFSQIVKRHRTVRPSLNSGGGWKVGRGVLTLALLPRLKPRTSMDICFACGSNKSDTIPRQMTTIL